MSKKMPRQHEIDELAGRLFSPMKSWISSSTTTSNTGWARNWTTRMRMKNNA
jgi:hypothetical protein